MALLYKALSLLIQYELHVNVTFGASRRLMSQVTAASRHPHAMPKLMQPSQSCHLNFSQNLASAMDPITAFGFAGTVIQFISFSSNLVSAAHTLKNSASGLLAKHEDIESITKSLQKLVINIKAGAQIPESGDDLTLSELGKDSVELARGCEAVAVDLLNLLSTLRLRRKGYLVAIRKIAQSIRDDDKIRTLESKLQHFTQQLILSLLHTVR